jgi:hypothetical protein
VLPTPPSLNPLPDAPGRKDITSMQSIPNYLSEVYSEDQYASLPSESEYQEVLATSLDDEKYAGYSEWSAELEQSQFEASLEARATVQTANGPMLIKRECSHKECGFTCARDTRIGGISI